MFDKILLYIKSFLISNLGNFTVKAIECEIKADIEGYEEYFKGFIDLIIELENKKTIIIDIKTARSSYFFNEYKDAKKDYQLTLYKHFYGKLENIQNENIETYFLVLEKDVETRKPLTLIPVSSGNKKIENANEWLTKSLKNINKKLFIPNRNSCRKYGENNICAFYKTQYCK